MVIQSSSLSYTAPRPARSWNPSRGALGVKFCAVALAAAFVFVPVALAHNARRNLTESIRREELRREELYTLRNATKVQWNRELNAASLDGRLAGQGMSMVLPTAGQIVKVTPVPGSAAPGRARPAQPHAVASR